MGDKSSLLLSLVSRLIQKSKDKNAKLGRIGNETKLDYVNTAYYIGLLKKEDPDKTAKTLAHRIRTWYNDPNLNVEEELEEILANAIGDHDLPAANILLRQEGFEILPIYTDTEIVQKLQDLGEAKSIYLNESTDKQTDEMAENRTILKPIYFTDETSGNIITWVSNFEKVVAANGWQETYQLTLLPVYLLGAANSFYERVIAKPDKPTSWQQWKTALINRFTPPGYKEQLRNELYSVKMQPTESVKTFINQQIDRGFAVDPAMSQQEMVQILCRSVHPDYLKLTATADRDSLENFSAAMERAEITLNYVKARSAEEEKENKQEKAISELQKKVEKLELSKKQTEQVTRGRGNGGGRRPQAFRGRGGFRPRGYQAPGFYQGGYQARGRSGYRGSPRFQRGSHYGYRGFNRGYRPWRTQRGFRGGYGNNPYNQQSQNWQGNQQQNNNNSNSNGNPKNGN